jgi:hypothetical protein
MAGGTRAGRIGFAINDQENPMNPQAPVRTAIAALTCGLLLVAPGLASAKANPTYRVAIKGNQVSTWNQSHTPTFACDATVNGAGSQDVPIITDKPVKLELFRPKGTPALLAEPGDAGAEYGFAQPILVDTNAEREGYQNIQAPGGNCNGTGGWDGQAPAPDCGLRFGTLRLSLGYGDPAAPGLVNQNTKDVLRLSGRYDDFFVVPALPGSEGNGLVIGQTFDNCPYWPAGQASGVDELITTGEKVPVAKLAKLKVGKSLKVSGGDQEPETSDDFSGETTIAWNLTIKRVG